MIKAIMTLIVIFGIAVVVTSVRAWGITQADHAAMTCTIWHLRNEHNQKEFEDAMRGTSTIFKEIESFPKPSIYFGLVIVGLGVVGLRVAARKSQ